MSTLPADDKYCSGCHPYGWPNGPMPHAPGCTAAPVIRPPKSNNVTIGVVQRVAEAAWRVLNHDNDPHSGLADDTANWHALTRAIRAELEKSTGNETPEQLGCLTAERDAARLVARKRLELLVEAGIVGGECEGCQMGHPVVNGYHEHGPSGIRIKCNAAESVGKDESGACAHCSHYHQNEFLPHKCCHCGSEKANQSPKDQSK